MLKKKMAAGVVALAMFSTLGRRLQPWWLQLR